jgi:hypothetical protein
MFHFHPLSLYTHARSRVSLTSNEVTTRFSAYFQDYEGNEMIMELSGPVKVPYLCNDGETQGNAFRTFDAIW